MEFKKEKPGAQPQVAAGQRAPGEFIETPLTPIGERPIGHPVSTSVTRAVRLAVYLWASEYHSSGLGMVDWFCSLGESRRDFTRRALADIMACPE